MAVREEGIGQLGAGGIAAKDELAAKKNKTKDDVLALLAEDPSTSSSNGGTKDPLVYLGRNDTLMGEMRFATPGQYDESAKLSEVADQYYDWDAKTKNKFLTQLGLAGYDVTKMKDGDIAQMWSTYAAQAASYYKSGRGQRLTPWDILAKDRAQRESYMKTPRSVTQTSTSYDMSTQQDAHAIFMQAAQSLLGRDPTKAEVASFQRTINAYEKANPTVTTATTNYIGDDVTGQTSTTKGGVKDSARSLMAMEDVKADPEYGAYQASTTYFDAMMDLIGG